MPPWGFLAYCNYMEVIDFLTEPSPMILPVSDRPTADAATTLMASLGESAGREAAMRADNSRDVGNVILFCRWRQVERLIVALSSCHIQGTVH